MTKPPDTMDHLQFTGALGNLSVQPAILPIRLDTAPPPHLDYSSVPPTPPPVTQNDSLVCMWGNCNSRFTSLAELVGHVNLDHLRLPINPTQDTNIVNAPQDVSRMACQWRDCNISTTESIPTSSTGDEANEVLNFLTNHLLYDHLGIVNHPQPPATGAEAPDAGLEVPGEAEDPMSPASSADPTHKCHWNSCGQTFSSNEILTQHINAVHVGAGKAQYECFWEGCNRNGSNGFSSKQKICRHLQTHTGHRPHQCKVCQQYFSESATLQQHMRRHTQEKPYTCDYPGCGKTFAITGALTIHKRIHNGQKPFKCKFCDKAVVSNILMNTP
ncbi:hypothetical protein DXG01_008358 [Tephrocybe rancida]|nr:hypothetical protein DXG01_008358 [Tephrocybe rancida]